MWATVVATSFAVLPVDLSVDYVIIRISRSDPHVGRVNELRNQGFPQPTLQWTNIKDFSRKNKEKDTKKSRNVPFVRLLFLVLLWGSVPTQF